jgi:hypothetical protein
VSGHNRMNVMLCPEWVVYGLSLFSEDIVLSISAHTTLSVCLSVGKDM